MFESLLTIGKKKINAALPNELGPGPQELIGEENGDGFFGEVASEDFVDGVTLANMVGLTDGTAHNTNIPWLKFLCQGKILFTPLRSVRYRVWWSHLYTKGLVYGTDNVGRFPIGTPTNQLVTVTIQGHRFLVRLFQGDAFDPTHKPDRIAPNPDWDNEWDRLMPNINSLTNKWASYTNTELGMITTNGDSAWVQEAYNGVNSSRLLRGGGSSVHGYHFRTDNDNNTSRGWRPVLELMPALHSPSLKVGYYFNEDDFFLAPRNLRAFYVSDINNLSGNE